jgi:hypothetical protein
MSDILTLPPRSDASNKKSVNNGYVPPHLRKGEKNTVSSTPVAVDMSTQSFPEMNTEVKKSNPSNVWNKISFKKKIDDLLEFEKLSEIEKQTRLDKKRIMEGRIVTNQTANDLQGLFIDADTFFNFVQDIDGVYFLFLSEQDEIDVAQTQYAYLLDIPLSPYTPPPTPPIQ